jgi:AICAR transformylase/IMP cyclohydrolase PurH
LRTFQENRLLGMGSGQPNRVKSLQIAIEKAGEEVKGSALASDAFFPFGSSSQPIFLFSSNSQPEMGLCE